VNRIVELLLWLVDARLLACIAASVGLHAAVARLLEELPERERAKDDVVVSVAVVVKEEPPPPKEPPPEPPPPPPEPPKVEPPPKPKPIEKVVAPKPVQATKVAPQPVDTPPTVTPPPPGAETTTQPKFGVSMSSTSSQSSGPPVPTGNTTVAEPTAGSGSAAPPKPLAEPAAAHEVTKMPLPQGRCTGVYTEAAKQAAVEGVVVLDLVVDEQGRARDITVASGLSHGLTESAVAALRACVFTPGERGGVRVPVRIRGFKIRFVMQDAP
jgi:protein TonB